MCLQVFLVCFLQEFHVLFLVAEFKVMGAA